MAEAAIFLVCAAVFIRNVKFAYWRKLCAPVMRNAVNASTGSGVGDVVLAIGRAERRLIGRSFKCLPRAMAAQWMLKRRRITTFLVIGAAPALGEARYTDLHAWVEYNGRIVMGYNSAQVFTPILIVTAG